MSPELDKALAGLRKAVILLRRCVRAQLAQIRSDIATELEVLRHSLSETRTGRQILAAFGAYHGSGKLYHVWRYDSPRGVIREKCVISRGCLIDTQGERWDLWLPLTPEEAADEA